MSGEAGLSEKLDGVLGWVATLLVFVVAYQGFSFLFHEWQEPVGPPPPRETPRATPPPLGGRFLGVEAKRTEDGLLVENVLPKGPAEAAGIQPGDVIVAVDQLSLLPHPSSDDAPKPVRALLAYLERLPVAARVTLTMRRDGGEQETRLEVVLNSEVTFQLELCEQMISDAVEQLLDISRSSGLWPLWPHYTVRELSPDQRPSTAVTALVAYALSRAGGPDAQTRESVIEGLLGYLDEDGGLTDPASLYPHRTYGTALLLMAIADDPQRREEAQRLAAWLAAAQVQETRGFDVYDSRYGAWSYYENYDANLRADISTARYALQGLSAGGVSRADPVWSRAHLFLEQCQNLALRSRADDPLRDQELARRDGGFSFQPRMSKAGQEILGNPGRLVVYRSYGSATADGLLARLAADGRDFSSHTGAELPTDDESALAALLWLADNYDLGENPGFPPERSAWRKGIYLYYLAGLAEGLHRAGVWRVTRGSEGHVWAAELVTTLRQHYNLRGSGQNYLGESGLMHEDHSTLAAAFAIVALSAARDRLMLGAGAELRASGRRPEPSPPPPDGPIARPPSGPVAQGRIVFRAKCGVCHNASKGANGPDLTEEGLGRAYLSRYRDPGRARDRLRSYLKAPSQVSPLLSRERGRYTGQMLSVSEQGVGEEEVSDLVSYLLSLW